MSVRQEIIALTNKWIDDNYTRVKRADDTIALYKKLGREDESRDVKGAHIQKADATTQILKLQKVVKLFTKDLMTDEHTTLWLKLASVLPQIGWTKAHKVIKQFPSIRSMFNATALEWQDIEGIGKKISETIVTLINKGEDDVQ